MMHTARWPRAIAASSARRERSAELPLPRKRGRVGEGVFGHPHAPSPTLPRCAGEGEFRMITIFGIPGPLLFGQLLLGLINGAFYALLSVGLAGIFVLFKI